MVTVTSTNPGPGARTWRAASAGIPHVNSAIQDAVAGLGRDRPAVEARPSLGLYLYGPLRACVGDRVAIDEHFTRRKAKALLALLYLERGRYLSKDELLERLWPNAEPLTRTSGRLKQTALLLRRALEAGRSRRTGWAYIVERDGSYFFNSRLPCQCDLDDFERELGLAYAAIQDGDVDAALDRFHHAFALRRGELLPDFREEEWAAPHIAADRERYLQALEDAAHFCEARGQDTGAIELLKRAFREDPLRESSAFQLMRHLGSRDPGEAIRVYNQLREALADRLQLEPDPKLTALFERIKADHTCEHRRQGGLSAPATGIS
jgi:DNA-binding SARP family transcriptional activator